MGWSALPSPCLAHTVLEAEAVASLTRVSLVRSDAGSLQTAQKVRVLQWHQGKAFPGPSLQTPGEVSEQGLSPALGEAAGVGTVPTCTHSPCWPGPASWAHSGRLLSPPRCSCKRSGLTWNQVAIPPCFSGQRAAKWMETPVGSRAPCPPLVEVLTSRDLA